MGIHAETVSAPHATPHWVPRHELYGFAALPAGQTHALALWSDDLVVVTGTPAEIRALLLRALSVVPEEET